MGIWSTIGKGLGIAGSVLGAPFTGGGSLGAIPAILGAGGSAIGAASNAAANNRGEKYAGQLDLERLLMEREMAQAGLQGQSDRDFFDQSIAREQEGRAGSADAFRKLMSAQRVLSPGAKPQLAGQYSIAPRQATGMERQGADALSAEVMARLQGGNPIAAPTRRPVNIGMPNVDESLLNAGGLEKAGSILGPILAFLGRSKTGVAGRPEDARVY